MAIVMPITSTAWVAWPLGAAETLTLSETSTVAPVASVVVVVVEAVVCTEPSLWRLVCAPRILDVAAVSMVR